MVFGINFPTKVAWGPLHFAEDKVGWSTIHDIFCALADEYGPERFSVPAILETLVEGESVFANCTYEVDSDGVAVMAVENPPMNVLSIKTIDDITNTVLAACADTSVRVILLTGKGKAFVAGANISEIQRLKNIHQVEDYAHKGHLMMNTIEGAVKPIICVINGFCLGGGLELAMACHMRIASDKARLGLPEINLGLIPGFGGTQRLTRIVGKGKALEMILTGNHITPAEAMEAGLVNKVVPQGSLMDEARALAKVIASKSRLSVGAAIDAASSGLDVSLDEGLEIEVENFARVTISIDAKEGTDAFQNKRKPVFKDR
jgi:enoyl-CoA hydratase/carnithine racemase